MCARQWMCGGGRQAETDKWMNDVFLVVQVYMTFLLFCFCNCKFSFTCVRVWCTHKKVTFVCVSEWKWMKVLFYYKLLQTFLHSSSSLSNRVTRCFCPFTCSAAWSSRLFTSSYLFLIPTYFGSISLYSLSAVFVWSIICCEYVRKTVNVWGMEASRDRQVDEWCVHRDTILHDLLDFLIFVLDSHIFRQHFLVRLTCRL